MSLVFFNGKYIEEAEVDIGIHSRAYTWGDGIFETMALVGGRVPLLHEHTARFKKSALLLELPLPKLWNETWLQLQLYELATRNNLQNAQLRLQLSRTEKKEEANLSITAKATGGKPFEWQAKSATVLYEPLCLANSFSFIKSTSRSKYVVAENFAKQKKMDECVLLNDKQELCESIFANIFVVKANQIFTPSISSGCVAGTARHFILKHFSSSFSISEKVISIAELKDADELFLSNAIRGIQSVAVLDNTIYSTNIGKQLASQLQQKLVTVYNSAL